MPFPVVAFQGQGTGGTQAFPFQITKGSDPNGNVYITVKYGTVSNIIPDNITDKLYINNTDTFYVKLQCQTNGKITTYVYLYEDNTPANNNDVITQGSPPPIFIVTLGAIVQGKVYQIVYDNITAYPIVYFLESVTDGLEDGQEPFNRWWGWITQ